MSAPAHAPSEIAVPLPAPEAAGALLAALAPAPRLVVRETRSFGTVTLDHAAHLRRRHPCRSCHGAGPVSKIARLEPRVAHERCIGCHQREQHGPSDCRGCHAVPPKPDPAAGTLATAGAAPDPDAGGSTARPREAPGAATAASAGAPADGGPAGTAAGSPPAEAEALPPELVRVLGGGLALVGGERRSPSSGPALHSTLREGDLVILYALEFASSTGSGRTAGLLGAGLARPLPRTHWSGFATVVGGFTAGDAPVSLVPSAGVRIGAEWMKGRMAFVVAATGTSDLVRRENRLGERVGGLSWGLSTYFGWVLTRR